MDSQFLCLPRELRDHIYSFLYSPGNDGKAHYISYCSAWSTTRLAVVRERTLSPSLQGALSLHKSSAQLRAETTHLLNQIKQSLTVHVRITNREDAAMFTALASQLQRLYPTLSTLRITWNISGEYTSILELIPQHLYRLKAIDLEVIDKLNTQNFWLEAHVLAAFRVNGSYVYLEKRIGNLNLRNKKVEHVVDGWITTGFYHSVYLLRFELEE